MIGNTPKAPLGLTQEEIAALPPDGGPHYNRLVFENSPYLLQHAGNPVDWRPWGEESFEAARREGKPIFLSIGYATCHWCHVMERESFEDPDIASLLNSRFIPVKVDREERPDIDQVYMTVTQGLTGRGGWPMTVFLTPDGRPFFAGTYFPPVNRSGQVGMRELLPRLAEAWEHDRDRVVASAEEITDWLTEAVKPAAEEVDRTDVLRLAFEQLRDRYDPSHGGFGQRPKFPTPHNLTFLLRYWKRTGEPRALEMVTTTLSAMRRGGIFDHLGFGFHRYSTDREWLVPHFEKMLYDQALLAMAYLDAWQATGQEEWASVAREVFDYVLRDLVLPEGGFSSAEDADSEGEEGRFYLWTSEQVREVLGEGADVWLVRYGFRDEGNYLDEATGHRTGANIPHRLQATEGSVTGGAKQIEDRDFRLEQAR
ncbi:thioredoxin domain-containing protein, partial [Gemmatimonadota bacterium]